MAAITAALIAAAATTGMAIHQSRQAKREGKAAERDLEYQTGLEQSRLEEKKQVGEAEIGARAQRARQRAMAASSQGYASTINTSPFGLANPNQKDVFGA
jgi:hypothetical protein